MKLLVTGGAGYIGSHFCKLASQVGHEIVVFDNLSTGHNKFAQYGEFILGDIRDQGKLEYTLRRHGIQGVVHFAAKALVGESVEHPDIYYSNNTCGTASLLQAMLNSNVRTLVFSSSCATYGVAEGGNLKETSPQVPIHPYGRSKLQCEEMILDFNRYKKFRAAMLRYFNVIGQDPEKQLWEEHVPETHILPNILKAAREQTVFKLYGKDYPTPDGTCVRDYIDVNDLGLIHLAALRQLEKKDLLISNVGRGQGYSNLQILAAVAKALGKKPVVEECDRRIGDPPQLVADAEFFRSWYSEPLKTLEQSIESLL